MIVNLALRPTMQSKPIAKDVMGAFRESVGEPPRKRTVIEAPFDSATLNSEYALTIGQPYHCYSMGLVVEVSDGCIEQCIKKKDTSQAEALGVVQGLYWQIGEMPDSTKLFRQEAPDTAEDVNKLELYLFYLPSPEQLWGWWIAEAFFHDAGGA